MKLRYYKNNYEKYLEGVLVEFFYHYINTYFSIGFNET